MNEALVDTIIEQDPIVQNIIYNNITHAHILIDSTEDTVQT